ncbi:hypothetical protein PF008_g22572 [Phytophthora fragariae]|uniref:Uncharacterized protein n=1 Tax=Phytophthora fragariae TaxID=53985 RepID=A0A6G0QTB5_9STRA|nr:hypothetical protein PF008_g22572 [Phytophthora fragariae]
MTIPPVAPAPSQRTRVLRGGLVWSAVRGARLLRALTSNGDQEEQESQEDQEQNVDDQFSADFPYELELCVPTAGHLALVLVRRPPGIQLKSPARSSTTPVTPTGSASAPAAPRVVYVLDALPPSRRGGYEDKSRSRKNNTPGAQLPQQQVDELELLQELFAPHTRAAGGKEGSVLIKAPLLCARFDCRVVSIRFIRSGGSLHKSQKLSKSSSRGLNDSFNLGAASSSRAVGAAAPLRCIVAREDGMAFLWEWQADLFQWVFLNRLCFLENPNLKWTRPVAAFTTTDLPLDSSMLGLSGEAGGGSGNGNGSGSSGATELVWWSTATKQEPKLKLRRLRFERATDALRATDVVVGSAFTPKPACDDIVKLLSSKLGGSRKPDNHLLRLTPANLESLHHLANWIVLAKRKLARLEGSSGGNFVESSSVSFTEDPGNRQSRAESDLTTVLANEDDLTTAQDEQYIRLYVSQLAAALARSVKDSNGSYNWSLFYWMEWLSRSKRNKVVRVVWLEQKRHPAIACSIVNVY